MTNGFMIFLNVWTILFLAKFFIGWGIECIIMTFISNDKIQEELNKITLSKKQTDHIFLLRIVSNIVTYILGLGVAFCIFNLIELIGK